MNLRHHPHRGLCATLLVWLSACGSTDSGDQPEDSPGGVPGNGAPATGATGSLASGGSMSGGAETGTGAAMGSGAALGSGGENGLGSGGANNVVDCSGIALAGYNLCESGAESCGAIFTDGSGCSAVCAAAGLTCTGASENAEDGTCAADLTAPSLPCESGHESDYCHCGGTPAGAGGMSSGGAGSGGAGSGGMGSGGSGGGDAALIGWASDPACGAQGTTGGGNGPPTITVTSIGQLESALKTNGPLVISVSGKIDTGGNKGISGIQDKTLIGTNNAEITGGLVISGADNLIVKNIHFSHGSNDTVEFTGSTCTWFDHCAFSDGKDGNLDIVRESNYVTVSWSKFFYTQGHTHMLSNLTGNADDKTGDRGKLKVTFHHNWWGAGVKERMPRVRFGQVHVFNNYYKYESVSGDSGQSYCVAAGKEADLVIENNYFDGSSSPIRYQTNGEGTAKIARSGNEFVSTSGTTLNSVGTAFTPPYPYTLDAGASVKDIVKAGAGPQ